MDKINIFRIIRDHLSTLRNYQTKRQRPGDILLFFVLPGILCAALMYFDRRIGSSARTILSTGLAIFAGLLFNLLLLVADVAVRVESDDKRSSHRLARIELVVLYELQANVAFAILLSLLALVSLISLELFETWEQRWILEAPIYYFSIVLFLTLLMVLKRAHAIMTKEVEPIQDRGPDSQVRQAS